MTGVFVLDLKKFKFVKDLRMNLDNLLSVSIRKDISDIIYFNQNYIDISNDNNNIIYYKNNNEYDFRKCRFIVYSNNKISLYFELSKITKLNNSNSKYILIYNKHGYDGVENSIDVLNGYVYSFSNLFYDKYLNEIQYIIKFFKLFGVKKMYIKSNMCVKFAIKNETSVFELLGGNNVDGKIRLVKNVNDDKRDVGMTGLIRKDDDDVYSNIIIKWNKIDILIKKFKKITIKNVISKLKIVMDMITSYFTHDSYIKLIDVNNESIFDSDSDSDSDNNLLLNLFEFISELYILLNKSNDKYLYELYLKSIENDELNKTLNYIIDKSYYAFISSDKIVKLDFVYYLRNIFVYCGMHHIYEIIL